MVSGMGCHDKEFKNREFERIQEILQRLRAPGGCPWDREQTMATLTPYIVEEAYELVEAIENNDENGIVEESGDLLLQVFFIAQIARESETFDVGHVLRYLSDKLERRHPHVFGELKVDSSYEVGVNWERIKAEERASKNKEQPSMLSGIPKSMPSLLRAYEMQRRAGKVGFDWPPEDISKVFDKVQEEIEELREVTVETPDKEERLQEELGDLLFGMVNLGRHLGVNGEKALQGACKKFFHRFSFIESRVAEGAKPWEAYSLEELDLLWEEAKKAETPGS